MKINIVELLKQVQPTTIQNYNLDASTFEEYKPEREYVMSERQFSTEVKSIAEYIEKMVTFDKQDAQIVVFTLIMELQNNMLWASKRFRLYREVLEIVSNNEAGSFYSILTKEALMELLDTDFFELLKSKHIVNGLEVIGVSRKTVADVISYIDQTNKVVYFD